MEEPLVSVIIPSYKRPSGLEVAIKSVLNQTYNNLEVIVVDDNDPNTEERRLTEEIIQKIKSDKVIYLKHPKNMNGSVARNTGISTSKGDYIAFLDNDDEFLPNKIEKQVNRLQELGPKYGACYTRYIRKKNGVRIDENIEKREGDVTLEILKGSFYCAAGSNLMVRREIVEILNGFKEDFKRRQDLEFLIRVSLITKIAQVDEVLLITHRDDRSNNIDVKNLRENSLQYLSLFEEYINGLSDMEKEMVIKSVHLTELRYYIYKVDLKNIIKLAKERNYSLTLLIRYFYYLVRRRIKKLSYGFNI